MARTRTPKRSALAALVLDAPARPRYFAGRLLTTQDFEREQEYHRQSRRRLALLTLGPGVVHGLKVRAGAKQVVVEPGIAIDPRGQEVIVPDPVTLPRRAADRFVVLRYAELLTDPVPTADGSLEHACTVETFGLSLSSMRPSAGEAVLVLARLVRRSKA